MADPFSSIPWNTPALWHAANASLAISLAGCGAANGAARDHAAQLRHLLEQTFPIMENLCRETCPACTDVCCQRAWVWVDFKDLLFLHLAGIDPPERQLLDRQGDHCRYAGPKGCRLERIQRPFVCTWYVCPAQSRILDRQPTEKNNLARILEQIKTRRKRMEASYIQAVS